MNTFDGVLAVCGGGNAGHALVVAASQHIAGEIHWLAGSAEKADVLRRGVFSQTGLQSSGAIIGTAHRVRAISADPADVIPRADLVIIAVPAFAHAAVLRQIAPHLKPTATIGALPTRGGFEFDATALLDGLEPKGKRVIFGLQTLPWSTRVQQPGTHVNFGAIKAGVLMASMPSRHAAGIAQLLADILGTHIVPTQNFLNMTLGNPGQIIHPGLMYGLFRQWSGAHYAQDEVPYFYRDASDDTGAFIEQLSADIGAVAAKVESASGGALNMSGVLTIHDWLKLSYPAQTADLSTVARCFRTGPLQARKAPMTEVTNGVFTPNFAYRYLSEDVPYGLVVTKAIAQIADIGTPALDTVLRWAQRKLQERYVVGGKLNAKTTAALPIPQNAGVTTLDSLIDWYAPDRAVIGTIGASEELAL